ncbi:MAG: 16S rRNA (cytidine(1402)-2'-O)-methyltransferase, partial [Pseudomonadota bacterium]
GTWKGEMVLLVGAGEAETPQAEDLDAALRGALAEMSMKDAVVAVTGATGLPRRTVYQRALELLSNE